MSVSIRPRHQQQPPQQHHQEQSQPSSQHGHQRPAAAVDGGEPALLPPPPPGTRGRPEPGLSRRPKSTQSKRSIITHVACQPCQRRKHKCDGQRPVCTSCLAKSRDDCAYDATGDQRRTTALKTRIQDLRRQAEDLKDIVRGIVAAPDHEAAFATARMLVAEGFTHTADIANAFRTEQANEESVSEQRDWAHDVFLADSLVVAHPPALYSYPTTSDPAMANATFQHDGAGGMPFPPLSFQRQEEPLELIQSDYENMPIELAGPFWQPKHQANSQFHAMAQEAQENDKLATVHSEHIGSDGEHRESEYCDVPETSSGLPQAFDTAYQGPYWHRSLSKP